MRSCFSTTMKVYALYTPQMQELLERFFLKTLPDDCEPHVRVLPQAGDYRWGGEGFAEAIEHKVDGILDAIRENQGDVVVWSDVDIQFFAPFAAHLQQLMEGRDLLFQSEVWPPDGRINAGFIAIRCDAKALGFFQSVRAQEFRKETWFEQGAIQTELEKGTSGVAWGTLPLEYWAYNHGGVPPEGALLHHANLEGVLWKKVEQLEAVRRFVEARDRVRGWDRLVEGWPVRVLPSWVLEGIRRRFVTEPAIEYRPSYKDWDKYKHLLD